MRNIKVTQLCDDYVTFRLFCWWSNWIDITILDYSGYGYLLQMSVSRNNNKKFKCVAFSSLFGMAHASTSDIVDLVPAIGIKQEPTHD